MAEQERNYDATDRLVISREERKLERAKEKAEKSENKLRETLAKQIAQNKQSIAKDALAATRDNTRRDKWSGKAVEGIFFDDGEVITGKEDRLWDRE